MIWVLVAIDLVGIVTAVGLAYARPHDLVRVTPMVLVCALSMVLMAVTISPNVFVVLVGFVVALGAGRVVQRLRNSRTSE